MKKPLLGSLLRVSLILSSAGVGFLVLQGGAHAQSKVQKINKKLVERAEKSVEAIEKVETQLEKTVDKYHDLFKKDKVKDRRKELKKLGDELKKTEDRVADLRKRNEEMQKEAAKFFAEWSKGLQKIDDLELRGLSQTTLDEAQARYGEVIGSGQRAAERYQGFLSSLENQIAYLELDMSDAAVNKLEPSEKKAAAEASELFKSIGELNRVTKDYIKSMK